MHDATLEEMWRIKEELSAPNDSWEEYAAALYAFQDEERRNGVRIHVFAAVQAGAGDLDYFSHRRACAGGYIAMSDE